MLKINKIRIEIQTVDGRYGLEENFDSFLNIISSDGNTSGKSSFISAIYYALGLEELIGGKGHKVLTPAYKESIIVAILAEEANSGAIITQNVLNSKVYLEISNGESPITIKRYAKSENSDISDSLVTVYHSTMERIFSSGTISEDFYVHSSGDSTKEKGFLKFLETYLSLNTPTVLSNKNAERPLYLQLIFSAFFIEQKRGWSDIFSAMPYLGIKEQKKRVIEYILNLDSFENEKKLLKIKSNIKSLESEWKLLIKELEYLISENQITVTGVQPTIHLIDSIEEITVSKPFEDTDYSLDNYILLREQNLHDLQNSFVNKNDNFNVLAEELNALENDIETLEEKIRTLKKTIQQDEVTISRLQKGLELLNLDIENNKDIRKLKQLGSSNDSKIFDEICPTCSQKINDTVIRDQNNITTMSIDENIQHLTSQKELFELSLQEKTTNLLDQKNKEKALTETLQQLRRLYKYTKRDVYSLPNEYSESIVIKRIELELEIKKIYELRIVIKELFEKLLLKSIEWKKQLDDLKKLPTDAYSSMDLKKIKQLRRNFIDNLREFNYKSTLIDIDTHKIKISLDTLLPVIDKFDLKFDSSASDNIRGIWAFTIALLQTSNQLNGNHPGILIFDEPGQHSIVQSDMSNFFKVLSELPETNQIIVGLTIGPENESIKKDFEGLNAKNIHFSAYAFSKY